VVKVPLHLARQKSGSTELAPGFAALLCAARHMFGLAAVDAVACIPPLRS